MPNKRRMGLSMPRHLDVVATTCPMFAVAAEAMYKTQKLRLPNAMDLRRNGSYIHNSFAAIFVFSSQGNAQATAGILYATPSRWSGLRVATHMPHNTHCNNKKFGLSMRLQLHGAAANNIPMTSLPLHRTHKGWACLCNAI